MTFQQLSFVVEVANCESINKAAERLYTSQSNVSNSIKALEEELGIQIFLRTKKGVSVTEEGREFLSYANEIIDKKIFVEDLYAKSHFRKQYFSVSSMRSFFLSTPITRLWPQISDGHGGSIYIRLKKQSFYDVLDDVQHCRSDLGIVFLMKSHSNRITRLCSVKDYYAVNHLEELRRIFKPLGYTVVYHSAPLKVIALVSEYEGNQAKLNKYESILLLIFRLLYLQKREKLSLDGAHVVATVGEIQEEYQKLGLPRKLDRITLEAILRTLKTYNLAKPLDRLTEEEAKIEIYPTVILALPDNVLKSSRDETAAALDKYRKAGEEDDV